MNLQYTSANQADIPVIFAQAKMLIDTYEDMASIDYDKVMAWMQRKIEANISRYTCVRKDGVPCAYYHLCEDGELDDLYVLPEFQNQGIGTQILHNCIEETSGKLYLYVFSRNFRAISFYERFGFTLRETLGKTRAIWHRNG